MNLNKDQKAPPLLEGELLLEGETSDGLFEVKVSILDVTHVDAASILKAESVERIELRDGQTRIPFRVYGSGPDPGKKYIVAATISTQDGKTESQTIYRTTQAIPVLLEEDPETLEIPLTYIK